MRASAVSAGQADTRWGYDLSAAVPSAAYPTDPILRAAVTAHLVRCTGLSRTHTDADLRVFLRWCAAQHLEPLAARRGDVELFVRWLQGAFLLRPSTVCRRLGSASTARASSTG